MIFYKESKWTARQYNVEIVTVILQLNIKENSPSSSNGSVDQNSSETIYDLKASIEKIAKRQGELEEKIETLIDKLSDNTEKSS